MSNGSIKRILVALDANEENRGALQTAALLAHQFQADLQALFVEDINLLRLAELPFAREMMFGSRGSRQITPANMERQIQAQATQLRQLVDATAQQNQIKVEFKVLRGQISDELLLAARHMDLLILGKNTQRQQQSIKLGRVAQDILGAINCNVLLLQSGASIERPVAVLFDGSQASQRALQLATQLAHGDHDQLKVIYPAVKPEQQLQLQQQVKGFTQLQGVDTGEIHLTFNTMEALLQAVRHANSRVLVVETHSDMFTAEDIKFLIQHSHIPVVVIR